MRSSTTDTISSSSPSPMHAASRPAVATRRLRLSRNVSFPLPFPFALADNRFVRGIPSRSCKLAPSQTAPSINQLVAFHDPPVDRAYYSCSGRSSRTRRAAAGPSAASRARSLARRLDTAARAWLRRAVGAGHRGNWVDGRFRQMNTGPFLNCTMRYPFGKDATVRVQGDGGETRREGAAAVSIRATMRLAAAWNRRLPEPQRPPLRSA